MEKKKGSDHLRDILNPGRKKNLIMENSDASATCLS